MEGLFFSFGLNLELSITLGVLIALIASQFFMISRRIRIKRSGSVPDVARAADVLKSLKKASKASTKLNEPVEKLDSGVFAQFESNLKRQDRKEKTAPVNKNGDVIVSLSSKSTRPTKEKPGDTGKPVSSTASKADHKKRIESLRKLNKSIKVEPIGNLFDDVQENLESKPADLKSSNKPPTKPSQQIESNEFLTENDLALDRDKKEGIELVLTMATNEFNEGNHEDSLGIIRQYTQNRTQQAESTEQIVQLIELKANNEFAMDQYDRAAQTYQEIVTQHIPKSSPDFLPLLERFIEKFKDVELEKHAIHFMFTALNEYRQMHDHLKMDTTYDDIETAYRQTEDWPRLIQTYQNHLSIKKVLKDYEGQLDLLDHLGKLLYDQGEEDKSRKCYKQRLVVEKEMERIDKKS